jgi:hypothetical protein
LKVPGPRHRITRIAANLDGQLTHDGVASERSDLCDLRPAVMVGRDSVMADASAIMRVLKDGLISMLARCLSSTAGRGNTRLGP